MSSLQFMYDIFSPKYSAYFKEAYLNIVYHNRYKVYSNMIQSHCFAIGHFLGEDSVTASFILSDGAILSFLIRILQTQKCIIFEC